MSEHNISTQTQKGLTHFRTPYTSTNPRTHIPKHNGQVLILLCCSSPHNQQRLRAIPQTVNLRARLLNNCASSVPKYKAFQKCVTHLKPETNQFIPKTKTWLAHCRIHIIKTTASKNNNNRFHTTPKQAYSISESMEKLSPQHQQHILIALHNP